MDDDASIRWALSEALRSWGYESAEAGTVAAGLAAFDAEEPAAVLLDIDLPDGSGLDALREIKARQPEAVVIMVTGAVVIQNTISALRGGAYDFVEAENSTGFHADQEAVRILGESVNFSRLGQLSLRGGIPPQPAGAPPAVASALPVATPSH